MPMGDNGSYYTIDEIDHQQYYCAVQWSDSIRNKRHVALSKMYREIQGMYCTIFKSGRDKPPILCSCVACSFGGGSTPWNLSGSYKLQASTFSHWFPKQEGQKSETNRIKRYQKCFLNLEAPHGLDYTRSRFRAASKPQKTEASLGFLPSGLSIETR